MDTAANQANQLRVAGLFAGIGGIELGLGAAGHHSELLCELDPAASAVLGHHFPGIATHRDVRTLKALPNVDLLAAGFPCQDLSQAGGTAGIEGKNSGLVGHVFRLLDGCRRKPRWLLLENVPFMLQLDRGKAMRYLVDELELRGYSWAYRVVDTRAFGLPQRRQRVILLASRTTDPRPVLLNQEAGPVETEFSKDRWCGFYWTEGLRGLGWAVDAVPTLKGGSALGIPSPPAVWIPETGFVGTPSITDCEKLQGFPAGWTETALDAPGARRGARWKLVGNAVSVPVARWIGARLATEATWDVGQDRSQLLPRGVAWPRAAWGHRGKVYSADVSMWPIRSQIPHLADFLETPLTPLSPRAARGFYSRALLGNLNFNDKPGFLEAVKQHIALSEIRAVA